MTDQTTQALEALDWLIISLDMSHTEWCDSASWRDDFKEKCETIRAALASSHSGESEITISMIEGRIDPSKTKCCHVIQGDNPMCIKCGVDTAAPPPGKDIGAMLERIPLGHITLSNMTDGGVSLKICDGIGGGTGKCEYFNGPTAAAAISNAMEKVK